MTAERCGATLDQVHGQLRCARDALHETDPTGCGAGPEEHAQHCWDCEESGWPDAVLTWTGYRERWS